MRDRSFVDGEGRRMDEICGDDGGIGRRGALKKIGAGAALAWVTPALVTFNVPAGAAGSLPPSHSVDHDPVDHH